MDSTRTQSNCATVGGAWFDNLDGWAIDTKACWRERSDRIMQHTGMNTATGYSITVWWMVPHPFIISDHQLTSCWWHTERPCLRSSTITLLAPKLNNGLELKKSGTSTNFDFSFNWPILPPKLLRVRQGATEMRLTELLENRTEH